MTTYILAVQAIDGNVIIKFDDEANLMNFIWSAQDHVLGMALAIEGE